MNAPLVLQLLRQFPRGPEAERGHYLPAVRAIQQIQGDVPCGYSSRQRQKLAVTEVQKVHAYCTAPALTMGPKMASSMGIEVDNPTYRPPLRSATFRKLSAYSSNAAV